MTQRIIADCRAGIAVMTAVAMVPLILAVGLAVDATRLWLVRAIWRSSKGKGLPGLHSDLWAPAVGPTLKTGMETVAEAILLGLQS